MASVSRKLKRNLKQESLDVARISVRSGITYGYGSTRRARKARRLSVRGGDMSTVLEHNSEEITE